MAITIIPAVGEIKPTPPNFKTDLSSVQEIIGGLAEVVPVFLFGRASGQLLVNEEGLLRRLPYNKVASIVANKTIVGDAVFLTFKDQWN